MTTRVHDGEIVAAARAFIDVFRRAFGHTPGAYRAQH